MLVTHLLTKVDLCYFSVQFSDQVKSGQCHKDLTETFPEHRSAG